MKRIDAALPLDHVRRDGRLERVAGDARPLEQRLRRRAERRRERERVARATRAARRCRARTSSSSVSGNGQRRERVDVRRRAPARARARRTGSRPTARGSAAASAAGTACRAGRGGRDAARRRSAARPAPARRAPRRARLELGRVGSPREPPREQQEHRRLARAAAARTRARAPTRRSSHWTSSIATRSGPRSASSCSDVADRDCERARSSTGSSASSSRAARPRAPAAAAAERGQRSRRATSSRRSPSPACASPRSASAGRDDEHPRPRARARSTAACQSVDLPIPASPSRTSTAGPSCGSSRNAATAASSSFPADDLEHGLPRADGDREPGNRKPLGRSRRATTMPADHPGARPPAGGRIDSTSRPLAATSHDTTEFEFHMSPVPSSSRPQTGLGMRGTRSSSRRATRGSSVRRRGLSTASPRSGMTPSRQQRTSYRNTRNRPSARCPTAPSQTTPRAAESSSGIGADSIAKRASGTVTISAEWYRSARGRRSRAATTSLVCLAVEPHEPPACAERQPVEVDARRLHRWSLQRSAPARDTCVPRVYGPARESDNR